MVNCSTVCQVDNAPRLDPDGRPPFDTPNGWTIEQMDNIDQKFLRP